MRLRKSPVLAGPRITRCPPRLRPWPAPTSPPRFVAAVRQRIGAKAISPVGPRSARTSVPADKRADGKEHRVCRTVPCHHGLCPKEFAKQWAALGESHLRTDCCWRFTANLSGHVRNSAAALAGSKRRLSTGKIPFQEENTPLAHDRLWLVVQGYDSNAEEGKAARKQGQSGSRQGRSRPHQNRPIIRAALGAGQKWEIVSRELHRGKSFSKNISKREGRRRRQHDYAASNAEINGKPTENLLQVDSTARIT